MKNLSRHPAVTSFNFKQCMNKVLVNHNYELPVRKLNSRLVNMSSITILLSEDNLIKILGKDPYLDTCQELVSQLAKDLNL